ncbi:MAG TPA: hypothetical protein VD978_13700 [Azospirillum sp.]|nr:hypothetical protein [Azospirillum sp.]
MRRPLACALLGASLLAAPAAWAAGGVPGDPESQRLALECLLKAAERVPKIAGLKIESEHIERHGDLFEGAFYVSAVHRFIYYDFQCAADMVSTTDLKGRTESLKRIEKVWLNLRPPVKK